MVRVTVSEGTLEGELLENTYGGRYYSFKGIPYAEPPVGKLRFKAPQPPKSWEGVRSAKKFGPICYQIPIGTTVSTGSEDCLYLNVYSPNLKPDKPLPVMFFVHGGAYIEGSSNDYGPQFLIRQDVIVVTINYRLEALGFLCLDTENIPGNAGMKDQVAALRWVNKNIQNFGGDPENITIFGESAGGASIGWLLVSPMTKGLFKRAIAQSGISTCYWGQSFEPRERALALARNLGCYSEDDKEVYEFFLSQPVDSLVGVQTRVTLFEEAKRLLEPLFVIVDEKKFGDNERFFYGDVYSIVSKGVHEGVEVITGYTEDEGLLNMGLGIPLAEKVNLINKFHEYVVPKPIAANTLIHDQIAVGKKIKEYYDLNKKLTTADWEQVLKYFSMEVFVYGTIQFVKLCANAKKNKVYLYKFTCKSERNVTAEEVGLASVVKDRVTVCHADDLSYLFETTFAKHVPVDTNSKTFEMINTVTKIWTDFAKYGNPTPNDSLGVYWTPYTVENQDYLEIGNELVARVQPEKEEVEFWENLFRKYAPKFVHSTYK